MNLPNAWECSIEVIIGLLENDKTEVASPFFPQGSDPKETTLNRWIQSAFNRSLKGDNESHALELASSMIARLERDEHALNWVFHREMCNLYLAGNDAQVIDFIKELPTETKLTLLSAITDLGKAEGIDHAYASQINQAMAQVCDLCSRPGTDGFTIIPTNTDLIGNLGCVVGYSGDRWISHNASPLQTLPKTLLIKMSDNAPFRWALSGTIKALVSQHPMAAHHKMEILDEMTFYSGADMRLSLSNHLARACNEAVTLDEFIQTPGPVLGGFLRHKRSNYGRYQQILSPECWVDQAERQQMMVTIAHLFATAELNKMSIVPMFEIMSENDISPDKIPEAIVLSEALNRALATTPGIPALNNFSRRLPDILSIQVIDEYLDQFGRSMAATCAHAFKGDGVIGTAAQSFLIRLTLGSFENPSNLLYEYGLARLAIESQAYMKENFGSVVGDMGFDELCYQLGLDGLPVQDNYRISRKAEVFDLLPQRLKTMENKLLMGISMKQEELEKASEALLERAFSQDIGL